MSSYVDATSGAAEHCEAMSSLHADLADTYQNIAQLCRQKLWHQLTLTVLPFVSTPSNLRTTSEGTNSFLALYDKVVLCVDKKLNSLSLCRIASAVADSLIASDGTAGKAVLENLVEQKARLGVQATLFVESKLYLLNLVLLERAGGEIEKSQLQSIHEALKVNAQKLQEMSTDTTMVHSAHYECSMKYRKAVGPPEAFFREALSYLNYSNVDDMNDPKALAIDLSLAALTGEGVFHFGEVVNTPLLKVLEGTDEAWLVEFMHVMARGDVVEFNKLSEKYASQIQGQAALVHRASSVKEKITLLALVNMVFQRPSAERTLTFEEVASEIQVSADQVELVVMRALSLKLIEGELDQVSQTLLVSWVMPRVLTEEQIKGLSTRFGEWAVKVSKTRDYVGEKTPALFA